MTVVLQVSDPHFGTERPNVVEALVEFAAALSPDILVLSGDITQRARKVQFDKAAFFLERLRAPAVLAIPGNHDVPLFNPAARLVAPYSGFSRVFGSDVEPTVSTQGCLAIGVKTTRRLRMTDGGIGKAQRERVASELRGALATQLRVVVTHQPVAVPRPSEHHNVLSGGEAAVRAWAAEGVDVILSGHIHLPFVVPLHETMGSLPKPVWAVGAGTAVSHRIRYDANNSVNVLRTSPERPRVCTVEMWTFSLENEAFVLESHTELG